MFKVSGFNPSIGSRENTSPCGTGFIGEQIGLELWSFKRTENET